MPTAMTFNNKAMTFGSTLTWMAINSYNPLNLPRFTIRCKFATGYTPTMGDTQTLVDVTTNTWDIYDRYGNVGALFSYNTSLIEILGANTTGAIGVEGMFYKCTALQRVAIFDTRGFDKFRDMFSGCTSLISVPLFNMSGLSSSRWPDVHSMFRGCTAVESGALDLYNHLVSVFPPESGTHRYCFTNCGSNTVTGAAELAQIPADWGGTAS